MRQVQSGDDLISLAFSCGHRDLSIVDVIVEINDLASPDSLQAGQTIEIPWPTPTADPNSLPADLPTEDVNADTGADNEQAAADNTLAPVEQALANSAAIATETLQPGLTWHRVQPNENIISIAGQYGANVEIMSQLNPEVTFSQCDYGLDTGGPNCIVNIYIGQLLRVPAPTPTPTIPPTASGSETPTPSPTPTRNIPSLTSPSNRTIFAVNELVTLRWVASGALGEDQVYQVRVEDTTAGVVYTAETRELSFIVPDVWQGQDARRHDYTWSVSVLNTDDPDNPLYTTEARTFTWQGRGEST